MSSIEKITQIANKLKDLETEYSRLGWVQYTVGFDLGIEETHKKIVAVYKDKNNFEIICEHKEKDLDSKDRRRVEIMYKQFKPYHLSKELNELDMEINKKTNELSKILNTHRCVFEGKEVSSVKLSEILYNDHDRARRKAAYFSRNQVNKPLVDGGFIDLINLRKKYAKLYGAEDFVSYQLEQQELDSSIFDNWVQQLHEMLPKINKIRSKYAKEYLNDDKIMPWDEAYISSKLAPSLNSKVDMSNYYCIISEFFKTFGIDITKYNITYDIFSRANKSEWGYNFTIETGKDSRILANVKDRYNEYNVLLHETGHAVHSFSLDADETILNNGISGIISEGIANLFGSFTYEKIFFEKFFKNNKEVEKEFAKIKEYQKLTSLRAIGRILFDQAFYRNDIKSLDDIYDLYWKVNSEVLKEEPFGQEPPWAFLIHHTTHPIYLHNYFMGDVTCEMLSKVFNKKHGTNSITEKPLEFGQFLINDVIKPSGQYKYQELFKRISGEEFSLKYMID
jgi:oligoendopeptidase F